MEKKNVITTIEMELESKHGSLQRIIGINDFCIAGGYIRDLFARGVSKDIDIFIPDEADYNKAVNVLSKEYSILKERKNSILFDTENEQIDLVKANNSDPFSVETREEAYNRIIDSFDIRCVQAFYSKGAGLVYKPGFVEDCLNKECNLATITLPYHTLGRLSKLRSKGWSISKEVESDILDYCYKAPWGVTKEVEYNIDKE